MPIEKRVSHATRATHFIAPTVQVKDDTLVVDAAPILYNGQHYDLPRSAYVAHKNDARVHVTGMVLIRRADKTMWLYFQEAPQPTAPDYDPAVYDFIHTLLFFDIPAQTSDLEKQTIVMSTIE